MPKKESGELDWKTIAKKQKQQKYFILGGLLLFGGLIAILVLWFTCYLGGYGCIQGYRFYWPHEPEPEPIDPTDFDNMKFKFGQLITWSLYT